jgi:4-amino-4-deoxy-L-arabinose transferase-like glycosyltransferase
VQALRVTAAATIDGVPPRFGRLRPYAWSTVGIVVGVTAIAHFVVAMRYGWHRDELYYAQAGHHLAFGYVDQPPLTPLTARLADLLPGGLLPLRIVAIAAQIGCVLLVAALARELGGARRAQTIAAACVVASPVAVGASLLLGTTVLDQLLVSATIVLIVRALRTRQLTAWIAAGVVAGVALENKQTVVVLIAGMLLGLLLTRRDALRDPGPWVAGTIALVLWLPNLLWNALNGWPSIDMARVLADKQGGPLVSFAQLPLAIVAVTGLLIVVWFVGLRWFLRDPEGGPHCWLVVLGAFALVTFAASGGKLYYAAPALFPAFAAGGVAIERRPWARGWFGSPALAVLVVVSWVSVTLLMLPFLPATNALVDEQRETYGWPQLARQAADVAKTLPPETVVFTSNYGEAGAIARFGPEYGLRAPVRSGHNAYGDWGPVAGGRPRVVLAVGEFDAQYLDRAWRRVQRVAPVRYADDVANEEITEHATIYVCRHPRGTWAELWPRLRHLS